MKSKMKTAVIGAGASGIMAAVTAAKYGAEVTLFERNQRVGKKILSTGNGKCNLSNLNFSMEQYYCEDPEKLHKMFRVFSVWDTMAFFENIGLMIKNKNGYLYPYSEQASAVLDVLRMELERMKVEVITQTGIAGAVYYPKREEFELQDDRGRIYTFSKVIIACGSPASLKKGEGLTGYELAAGFGHEIRPVVPGLVQLESDESFVKPLAGVRCQAAVRLMVDRKEAAFEKGEVQFTAYGISGIPVFQFSRIAAYALKEGKDVRVLVDFFPDQEDKAFIYMNRLRYESQMDKTLEAYLTGTLHKKINMMIIKQAGLKPGMKAKDAGWHKIAELMQGCRNLSIHISGDHAAQNAQVCAGGVGLKQVDTELESALIKGLYFAGEVLDVDGKCGGYNLQWAWTSGYIAGRNAAGSSTREIAETKEDMPPKDRGEC